jgi:hypothetical protein
MRKHILTFICCTLFFSTISIAQKARFGFSAGATLANVSMKMNNIKISTSSKIGLTAGILLDKPISDHLIFQPALNFVQKGAKSKENDGQATLNYLEVPLNFMYRSNNRDGFFAGAGPSLAYGLSGTSKAGSDKEDINFGSDDNDDLKRMDLGDNFTAGYITKGGILLALNYNMGLSNLEPESDYGKTRNNYWGLRLGYILK